MTLKYMTLENFVGLCANGELILNPELRHLSGKTM